MDTGSEIIIESLDICDYLDEKYPNPPLYPSNKDQAEKDKEYLKQFIKYHNVFYKTIMAKDLNFPEFVARSRVLLQEMEDELVQRGGKNTNFISFKVQIDLIFNFWFQVLISVGKLR